MDFPLLRILLVDDEPLALERARRLLGVVGGVEVIGECSNGRDALACIEADPPDAVLLDINMPELDGLRMLEALDDPPAIIFATAYDQHAVRAFDLDATDYLLKPFSAERLGRALAKVKKQLGDHTQADLANTASSSGVRIPVDTGRCIQMIPSENLSGARIDESVVFLLHDDGELLCYAGTLQNLELHLPPRSFLRASRSAIVNLNAIERFEPTEEGGLKLSLRGGHTEQVSRRRARFFRRRLNLS